MHSKTELYNNVLSLAGSTIFIGNADTDTSPKAMAMNAVYDGARREVLRQHNWGFAKRRAALTEVGTNETDWEYQYKYPNDCLAARKIQGANRTDRPIPYEIGQYTDDDNGTIRVLLTDEPDAILIYTVDEEDLKMFDELSFSALAGLIGFRASKSITTDKAAPQTAWNYYLNSINMAKAGDANEQIPDDPSDADWIRARSN